MFGSDIGGRLSQRALVYSFRGSGRSMQEGNDSVDLRSRTLASTAKMIVLLQSSQSNGSTPVADAT